MSKHLSKTQSTALLSALQTRFLQHAVRHSSIVWDDVFARLQAQPAKLLTIQHMEETGGEPDVVGQDGNGAYLFVDCAAESPKGRRSLCYDRAALNARKENKPANSVQDVAAALGINLLTETQYRLLQTLGEFDAKTSSWIHTPGEIRALGGALFCDRRYGTVFTYHNGAESYYAARGFRGMLLV